MRQTFGRMSSSNAGQLDDVIDWSSRLIVDGGMVQMHIARLATLEAEF